MFLVAVRRAVIVSYALLGCACGGGQLERLLDARLEPSDELRDESTPARAPAPSVIRAPEVQSEKPVRRDGDEEVAAPRPGVLPIVTLPGFSMLEGGKSRVFVEISGKVPVNESASDSELSLHLSGVSVPEKVNRLALPTTHFSTPVKRIRVQQAGDGADVIIELRAKVGHQTKLRPIPFGTRLTIEFPRLPEQAEVAIGVPIRPDRPDAGMRPVTAGDPFETE